MTTLILARLAPWHRASFTNTTCSSLSVSEQNSTTLANYKTASAITILGSQLSVVITFRVSRRPREVYCGHARLSVCVSVRGRMPTLLHGPGCNLGEW